MKSGISTARTAGVRRQPQAQAWGSRAHEFTRQPPQVAQEQESLNTLSGVVALKNPFHIPRPKLFAEKAPALSRLLLPAPWRRAPRAATLPVRAIASAPPAPLQSRSLFSIRKSRKCSSNPTRLFTRKLGGCAALSPRRVAEKHQNFFSFGGLYGCIRRKPLS